MNTCFLLPRQSVGLGAPQTISLHPLPSPPPTVAGSWVCILSFEEHFFTNFKFATVPESCLGAYVCHRWPVVLHRDQRLLLDVPSPPLPRRKLFDTQGVLLGFESVYKPLENIS